MSMLSPSPKSSRVLACVSCQARKIKCDHNSPCGHCVKANIECVPRAPVTRKKRDPTRALKSRLAKCEELLSEYSATPPAESSTRSSIDSAGNSITPGQLVRDYSGTVTFAVNNIWAKIHHELHLMHELLDESSADVGQNNYGTTTPLTDGTAGLILPPTANANIQDLFPSAAHGFAMWQIFLDRVNPITKIIHVPTVQPLLIEAMGDILSLSEPEQTLLLSIYLIAVTSMQDEECRRLMSYSKTDALNRFSTGVCIMFKRVNILQSYDLIVLQALVFYMYSLLGRHNRDAAWIMNGVLVRIAQKMGLHMDGENLNLSPFESEMRRRIWWQIVQLDIHYAQMTGLGFSLLPRGWNTRKPTNISDSDMYPTMSSIRPTDGPTDMIYCMMTSDISEFIHSESVIQSLITHYQSAPLSVSEMGKAHEQIEQLESRVAAIAEKYGDRSMSPVHELGLDTGSFVVRMLREIVAYSQELMNREEKIWNPTDILWKVMIPSGYRYAELLQSVKARGCFLWYFAAQFPVEIMTFIVGQLAGHVEGPSVDKAWIHVQQIYYYHQDLLDMSIKPHVELGTYVLRSWRKRTELLRNSGQVPPEPLECILELRHLLPRGEDSQPETPVVGSVVSFDYPGDGLMDMFKGHDGLPYTFMY
ncbi:fungal-specific transcription factor domain-containing protein [Xylariales sp. PMI_506]|nr:fungal-specific transcription factor domain-containing protein [Xylariales sp. PMI_506]